MEYSAQAKTWIEGHRGDIHGVTLVGGLDAINLQIQDDVAIELGG